MFERACLWYSGGRALLQARQYAAEEGLCILNSVLGPQDGMSTMEGTRNLEISDLWL